MVRAFKRVGTLSRKRGSPEGEPKSGLLISGNTTNARCANTDCDPSRDAIHGWNSSD